MSSKKTILVIGSSADTFILKDGRREPVGYYLNELEVPGQAALDAGYEMVLATPSGNRPVMANRRAIWIEGAAGGLRSLEATS